MYSCTCPDWACKRACKHVSSGEYHFFAKDFINSLVAVDLHTLQPTEQQRPTSALSDRQLFHDDGGDEFSDQSDGQKSDGQEITSEDENSKFEAEEAEEMLVQIRSIRHAAKELERATEYLEPAALISMLQHRQLLHTVSSAIANFSGCLPTLATHQIGRKHITQKGTLARPSRRMQEPLSQGATQEMSQTLHIRPSELQNKRVLPCIS